MSTDVLPTSVLLFRARRDLDNARIAQQQAEDAQHVAEDQARRADKRATQAKDEADSWRMFAVALANTHLIDQYASHRLPDDMRQTIVDCLKDDWSHTRSIDGLPVEALVNGCEEELT